MASALGPQKCLSSWAELSFGAQPSKSLGMGLGGILRTVQGAAWIGAAGSSIGKGWWPQCTKALEAQMCSGERPREVTALGVLPVAQSAAKGNGDKHSRLEDKPPICIDLDQKEPLWFSASLAGFQGLLRSLLRKAHVL